MADRHHWTPKCRGGKVTDLIHRICHRKIHSVFTEKELEREFNSPEKLRDHPEIAKFIAWVARKPHDFYDGSVTHKRKRR
jgi:hypothetical protein